MTRQSPGAKGAILGVTAVSCWRAAISSRRAEAARGGAARQADRGHARPDHRRPGGAASSQAQGPPIRVAELFELSRAMPDRADIPNVLLSLSQISAETGVTFKSITPGSPVSLGSYQRIPIDLVFEGHFYDLADFLFRLRNLVGVHRGVLDATGRLFSVDWIQLDQGTLHFPQVKATLALSAYVFGDGSATRSRPAQPALGGRPATSTPSTDGPPALPSTTPASGESDPSPSPQRPRDRPPPEHEQQPVRRTHARGEAEAPEEDPGGHLGDLPRRRRLPAPADHGRRRRRRIGRAGRAGHPGPAAGGRSVRGAARHRPGLGDGGLGTADLVRPVQEQGSVRPAALDRTQHRHGNAGHGGPVTPAPRHRRRSRPSRRRSLRPRRRRGAPRRTGG